MAGNKHFGSFGLGLLVGVLGGIVIGFLFAPHTGKETRHFLKDRAEDLGEFARELTADRKKVYLENWEKPESET